MDHDVISPTLPSEFQTFTSSFPQNNEQGAELNQKGLLKKWKMIKNISKKYDIPPTPKVGAPIG